MIVKQDYYDVRIASQFCRNSLRCDRSWLLSSMTLEKSVSGLHTTSLQRYIIIYYREGLH